MGVLSQNQFAFDSYRVDGHGDHGEPRDCGDALQQREILYAKDPGTLTDEDGMRLR